MRGVVSKQPDTQITLVSWPTAWSAGKSKLSGQNKESVLLDSLLHHVLGTISQCQLTNFSIFEASICSLGMKCDDHAFFLKMVTRQSLDYSSIISTMKYYNCFVGRHFRSEILTYLIVLQVAI